MNEKEILLLSIKDFLTPKMVKLALLPFVITLFIMYIIFFGIAGMGVESLSTLHIESSQTTIQNNTQDTQTLSAVLEGSDIIKFLMSYTLTSWLATFLIYAVGGFLTLYLSIFLAVVILGFLTPLILKELQTRHYKDLQMIGYGNLTYLIFSIIKSTLAMIALFILLLPFYFIPLLNVVALNLPLYYFFHKMLTLDVSSTICTLEEEKQINFFSANRLKIKTLALYLLSLLPFSIFLGAVFFVIYLGHTYFLEVKKLR